MPNLLEADNTSNLNMPLLNANHRHSMIEKGGNAKSGLVPQTIYRTQTLADQQFKARNSLVQTDNLKNQVSLNAKKSFQSTLDQNSKIIEYMNLLMGKSAPRPQKQGEQAFRHRRTRTRMESIIQKQVDCDTHTRQTSTGVDCYTLITRANSQLEHRNGRQHEFDGLSKDYQIRAEQQKLRIRLQPITNLHTVMHPSTRRRNNKDLACSALASSDKLPSKEQDERILTK